MQVHQCAHAVEWRFLLSGVTLGTVASLPNPAPRWLTDKSWTQILNLSSIPAFQVACTRSALQQAWCIVLEFGGNKQQLLNSFDLVTRSHA